MRFAILLLLCAAPAFAQKRAILPAGATPAGPYSPGIVTSDGTLYVAGQVGRDASDFDDEVKRTLDNVGAVLKGAGMTFADVVSTTVYLTDMDKFADMNAVYLTYFPEPRPARATVGVAKLAGTSHIEISAIAKRAPQQQSGAGFVSNAKIDTVPPSLPSELQNGILIYSKTNGYRDEPALLASQAALAAIAKSHRWPFLLTENGAVMTPEILARFKLVIWNNTSGDTLSPAQRDAFKTWVEQGGSYFGIHGAGGDPLENHGHSSLADWKWYVESLVGAQFVVHSSIMPGDIHIADGTSPLAKNLPATWHRAEEWYAFAKNPRAQPGFHIIATVDEQSYTPGRATMGADHPLIWWHCAGKGHALYSALGHAANMYSEPLMLQFLENAMEWGLTESGKACPAN